MLVLDCGLPEVEDRRVVVVLPATALLDKLLSEVLLEEESKILLEETVEEEVLSEDVSSIGATG